MTVQQLKEREIEITGKLEESTSIQRKIEAALRLKHEEVYQANREKENTTNELRSRLQMEDQLRMEADNLSSQRDDLESEVNELKSKLTELTL